MKRTNKQSPSPPASAGPQIIQPRPPTLLDLPPYSLATTLRINVYEVISRAIDEGVAYGYTRAYKHTDRPDPETLKEAIHTAVMGSLCEVLQFGDA